jgi:hypothetical protein
MPEHRRPHRRFAPGLLLLLALAACGGTEAATAAPDGGAPDAGGPDAGTDGGADCWQAAAVPDVSKLGLAGPGYPAPAAAGACTSTEFVLTSNGIPSYTFVALTPNGLQAKSYTFHLPRHPAEAATKAAVPLLGSVAVSVTGLPIFGPTENPNDGYRDPFLDNQLMALLDSCNGHTAPGGTYHLHARPDCLLVGLGGERKGLVLGWAYDGYPILAPVVCADAACSATKRVQSSWKLTIPVYSTTTRGPAWDIHAYVDGLGDLDKCNGLKITEAGSPFDYAYFATDSFPYFLGCYHGTPTTNR